MTSSNQRGNVLISVLWVIVTIAILVFALGFEARSDIERTILYRDRAKAYWLARAGVEKVKFDYASSKMRGEQLAERKVRHRYEFPSGYAICSIKSSTSVMSINSPRREYWNQLLKLYHVEEGQADQIIDAIFDWTDPGDEVMLNGAEKDHYQSLNPPYQPRNGPFFSVEEILLVRGITEAMFYGTPGEDGVPGLKDLLTVKNSGFQQFDINSCPIGILMAFLEVTREEAKQLIEARNEKPFESIQEATNHASFGGVDKLFQFFTVYQGNQFVIKATGFVNESPARYTVEDEVRYTGGGRVFVNISHKDFSLEHDDEGSKEEDEE